MEDEDLRGLATLPNRNVKYYYMGYLQPSAALYNLICIVLFLFCFLYVALYRLLHNKSYLPDL